MPNAVFNKFADNLTRLHIEKKSYTLDGDQISLCKVTDKQKLETAKTLLAMSLDATRIYGFEPESVRKLSCCAYQAVKNLAKLPQVNSQEIKNLEQQAVWNLMGHTQVPQMDDSQKALFDKLVVGNQIHYNVNRLHKMNSETPMSLLVDGKWVALKDLQQVAKGEEIFFTNAAGETLFKTDNKYKLKDYYFCGQNGILPGDKFSDTKVFDKGFQTIPNHDGKHYVVVCTGIPKEEGFSILGDHSYLGLINEKGEEMYWGEWGLFGNANVMGSYQAPDRMEQMPFTHHHTTKTRIEITKAQYDLLKSQALIDVQKKRLDPIDAEDNCTAFVSKRLQQVGIKVESQTTQINLFHKWALSMILPKSWYKPVAKFIDSIPLWIRAPFHYVSPFYPIGIIFGLVQTLSGFYFQQGRSPLYNFKFLFKAILTPWVPNIHHPTLLKAWQEKQSKKLSHPA